VPQQDTHECRPQTSALVIVTHDQAELRNVARARIEFRGGD
jgi:hypothetical protein